MHCIGRLLLLAGCAGSALSMAAAAQAQPRQVIDLPAQPLAQELHALEDRTSANVLFSPEVVAGIQGRAVRHAHSAQEAIAQMIAGAPLTVVREQGALLVRPAVVPASMSYGSGANAPASEPSSPPPPSAPAPVPPTASAAADPASAPVAASSQLQEVVVTARRRAESLQSVPVAVTAFRGSDLTERHINSALDLANNTPSLIAIQSGYPAEFGGFVLRGQGPAFNGTSGTVTYFAEAPDPYLGLDGRPGSYYDLADVQVLKGPQGTLFGKNATGGNVLFEPQRPTNTLGGYFNGQLGDYGEREFDAAVNVPIIDDKVLLRVAGTAERRDGYTTDVGPYYPGKRYDNLAYEGFRVGLTLRPFNGLESYTMYRYQQSYTNGPGTVPYLLDPTRTDLDAAFPNRVAAFEAQQARGPREISLDFNEFDRAQYNQAMNSTTLRLFDGLQLKNIVSYTRDYISYAYDYDGGPLPLAGQTSPNSPTTGTDYFSEELQLQGQNFGHKLQYAAGVFDDDLHTPRPDGGNFEAYPTTALLGELIPIQLLGANHSQAAFAQGTLDLGVFTPVLNGLSVTAGYRYTNEYSSSAESELGGPFVPGSASYHYGSYTFDIDYKLFRDTLIYATFRDAFKSGGFNSLVPADSPFATYPPEELKDKEFGVKTTQHFLGMQARFDIDGFFGDYNNIQREVVEVFNGVPSEVVASAAKGEIDGLELETSLIPLPGLEFSLNYSYTASGYTGTNQAAAPLLAGAPFPYTPRDKVSLVTRYQLPVPSRYGVFTASETLTYQSKQSIAQSNQDLVAAYLPGFGQLNLRLDWDHVMGNTFGVSFYMTNATNELQAVGQGDFYPAYGVETRTYDPPRMFGFQLRYPFGGRS